MSTKKEENQDSESTERSENRKKSDQNKKTHSLSEKSAQNSKSPENLIKENQTRRPRGRPRKNPINDVSSPLPEKEQKNKEKSDNKLSPTKSKNQVSPVKSTTQNHSEKVPDRQAHSNNNIGNDNQQKSHHAKAGNILYKNIHNTSNKSSPKKSSIISNSDTSTKEAAEKEEPIKIEGFNYIVAHSRLETIETRINDKLIPEMVHPAQSIVYDRLHQEALFLNEKEYAKRKNYQIVRTLKRIPDCWEPRPWDKTEEKMTEFENFEFNEMVNNFEPFDSDGEIREWYKSKDVRAVTRQKKRLPVLFKVSLINFSTDEFDDQTDFDSF